MIIYVGYILTDYEHAVCMGMNKDKVQTVLNDYPQQYKWINEYNINKNQVVDFTEDC